jgi:fucose 4-O-acetylase-like acetyltransferase
VDPEGAAKGQRWLGIDLYRGAAAYGVVVIHSFGHARRTVSTELLIIFFLNFAVPFFLATSLFLTAGRFLSRGTGGFLRTRVDRLIVPYLVWTLIFLVTRSAVHAATGRWDDLRALHAYPLDLLFLGQASGQLYFLPLLFVGELEAVVLFQVLGDRLRRPALVALFFAGAVALVWFNPLRYSPLLRDRSLAPPLMIGLNLVNFAVWCLPYVAGGVLLQLGPVRERVGRLGLVPGVLLLAALLAFDAGFTFGVRGALDRTFPPAVREVILAFGLLVSALAVSKAVPPGRWLSSLGACTFGIYLAHPLVLQSAEPILNRLGGSRPPLVTPWRITASAALVFLVTWALVAVVLRVPVLARVLFGTRARA